MSVSQHVAPGPVQYRFVATVLWCIRRCICNGCCHPTEQRPDARVHTSKTESPLCPSPAMFRPVPDSSAATDDRQESEELIRVLCPRPLPSHGWLSVPSLMYLDVAQHSPFLKVRPAAMRSNISGGIGLPVCQCLAKLLKVSLSYTHFSCIWEGASTASQSMLLSMGTHRQTHGIMRRAGAAGERSRSTEAVLRAQRCHLKLSIALEVRGPASQHTATTYSTTSPYPFIRRPIIYIIYTAQPRPTPSYDVQAPGCACPCCFPRLHQG